MATPPRIAADVNLARRLEQAEAAANCDYVAARAKAIPSSDVAWIEVAGARACFDGVDSPCTQTFGLGVLEPTASEHFDAIERFFDDRGAATAHEICPLAGVALSTTLVARGYRPIEQSNVLYQPLDEDVLGAPMPESPITVRLIEPGEEQIWAETCAAGWRDEAPGIDEFLAGLAALIPHRTCAHNFLAEIGDQPIAAGAMNVDLGVALLAGACTVLEFRQRGAQQALLAARLEFARQRGCDVAMIVAMPGSSSQRNAERRGFRVAYTRTKWIREYKPG